ncbi:MAG TPA: pantoate--beta-alanine ligase [Gemmatimonadales bacterium]|nr:pantoate--beta-alanine ligase [Gemmatimonadales bacterium]
MDTLSAPSALRARVEAERAAGRRIALVPTMGALHEGHLALVDEARRRADVVVLSLFVNPLQFAPGEDLARYPRKLERDEAMARARGVDVLFAPSADALYPPGFEVHVVPGEAALRWEGTVRPGHFIGVLTVVAKLFHLAQPDVACFGQKDIQQVTLVRRMVRDLDWHLAIAVVPTVREVDGLAMSSRNVFLSAETRREAVALPRALFAARDAWSHGERSASALTATVQGVLAASPEIRVDYIAVAEPEAMRPVEVAEPGTIVAAAVRIGATRLIDNVILHEGYR